MSVADPQTAVPKPKLRWFQFSLQTLLVVVTLCAIPCSWLAVKMRQARRQRDAADAIETLGGLVVWSEPSGPVWLRSVLGDDLFRHVLHVSFVNTQVTDTDLKYLEHLDQLQDLTLNNTKITDAGLRHLEGMSQLKSLGLQGVQITDAGLQYLGGLSQLHWLYLTNSRITDAGLQHFAGLRQLETLGLNGTGITDDGLENLRGLSQLQVLDLRDTKVTDSGVKQLQKSLPKCLIDDGPIWRDATDEDLKDLEKELSSWK